MLVEYATVFGVEVDRLNRIAYCESRFNQYAGNGIYKGLYQISDTTWMTYRKRMALPSDIELRLDARGPVGTVAYMLAQRV